MVGTYVLAAGVVLTPLCAYTLDGRVRSFVLSRERGGERFAFALLNEMGDGRYHVALWSGITLAGYITGNREIYEFGKYGGLSFLLTGISTLALKSAIGRARPHTGLGVMHFRPLSLDDDFHSLPSGHTSVAFSAAGYVFSKTDNPLVKWGTLVLASGVGLARVYYDRHWLSDVLLGASLGFSIGYTVGRFSGE